MAPCRNCGSSQVDEDGALGYTICMGCGNVLEDQVIVSEMSFAEGGGGRKHFMGSLVTEDGSVIGSGNLPNKFGCNKNSQRKIVEEATRVMVCIANRLKLAQQHIDSAVMFYKMALSKRILQGKRKCHVCAACLYIVCRTENTPHILLDFSEIIHENMFHLLRVYTRLCHALCIKLPAADPCLFINRYAQRLQLGDKADVICVTAMRLVSRMKRDWMATGRRPSSLCGAALVVACRLHGCSRNLSDIAKIVRNNTHTISKRLREFSETPSSKLSIEEFESVDLGEEEDPPAYKVLKQRHKQKEEDMARVEEEVTSYKEELEREFQSVAGQVNLEQGGGGTAADSAPLYRAPAFTSAGDQPTAEQAPSQQLATSPPGPISTKGHGIATAYGAIPDYVAGESAPASAAQETVTKRIVKKEEMEEEEEEAGWSDIDDNEISSFILKPWEIEIKTRRWQEGEFDDFLAERERKRLEKEEELRTKPKRKYRRVQRSINASKGAPKTPGEAMEKMIKEKKLSSKINYDVLKNLGSECDATIARIRRDTEPSASDGEGSSTDKAAPSKRSRFETLDSQIMEEEEVEEEEEYFNDYSERLALNDAMGAFSADDEDL